MLGSFLPPAPTPSLTTHSAPFLSSPLHTWQNILASLVFDESDHLCNSSPSVGLLLIYCINIWCLDCPNISGETTNIQVLLTGNYIYAN
jgi:hypothetical protein